MSEDQINYVFGYLFRQIIIAKYERFLNVKSKYYAKTDNRTYGEQSFKSIEGSGS
jgi:membrane protein DedA with SNARE-associated domain